MGKNKQKKLEDLARLVRYWCLRSTTEAGSGHPSSSLSAADLMVGLMFGGFFHYDPNNPHYCNNDRLIFSKGHASPLFYSLWLAAGQVSPNEILALRKFKSPLEGHPTMLFPFTEAATGSLGQGLSIGVGMALSAKYLDKLPYRIFVLLGDSEMSEGSVWEAIQLAAYYKLNNLVGVIDVNRLGQRGETMLGYRISEYKNRIIAFGWRAIVIDGHNFGQITKAYQLASREKFRPVMIIARTIKGKGVKFIENKNGWHGKAIPRSNLEKALKFLGKVRLGLRGKVAKPKKLFIVPDKPSGLAKNNYFLKGPLSTRKAFGVALAKISRKMPQVISLDAEVSNSTFAEVFAKEHPNRFFEMFIAEQNMVGVAVGLSRLGKIPFVSTFAAFFTRAFDQIRMARYSEANIKFVGSHAGVSIGRDGVSQMGLEDIAMFRAVLGSVIFYPSDAISTEKLVEISARQRGIFYIRTTRSATPVIYKRGDKFKVGGSKVLRSSKKDKVTIVGAGITLFESLAAADELLKQGITARVIDLYSIKPVDKKSLIKAARETGNIIVVEDHFTEGGIGEAVRAALGDICCRVISLAVRKMPHSAAPQELLNYEQISKSAIIKAVSKVI